MHLPAAVRAVRAAEDGEDVPVACLGCRPEWARQPHMRMLHAFAFRGALRDNFPPVRQADARRAPAAARAKRSRLSPAGETSPYGTQHASSASNPDYAFVGRELDYLLVVA